MKIILSPAKKMRQDTDSMEIQGLPVFLNQTEEILSQLSAMTYPELKRLWVCNDKIAKQNEERLRNMNLRKCLTPAVLSYDGIAYQYMAPGVFADGEFEYVQKNLRILSAFYGVVKPMDGVAPYRLEMQAKVQICGYKDLYDYWGDRLYREVLDESRIIVNLASKEYSKCIEKYLTPADTYITCFFGEESGGKVVQKGVHVKMARGEMVRFLAEKHIEEPEEMKQFNRLGFTYCQERSDEKTYVWLRGDRE